jgi:hypothetical protein
MSLRAALVRPAVTLGLAAALVVGCDTTLLLDNATLQQKITAGLQQQVQVDAVVTCPDDRPIKQGDTFTCTAVTTDGTNLTITVVQKDNSGNVTWNVTDAT